MWIFYLPALLTGWLVYELIDSSNDDDDKDDDRDTDDIQLNGGAGEDLLTGSEMDDSMFGLAAADVMSGEEGDDRMFGGEGDDGLFGQFGSDLLRGGDGDDVIVDGDGADTMQGDTGDDVIIGSGFVDEAAFFDAVADADETTTVEDVLDQIEPDFATDTDTQGDVIDGGAGDDTVLFGIGDTVTGGAGADTLGGGDWLEGQDHATIEDFDAAEDVLVYSIAADAAMPEITVNHVVDGAEADADAAVYANGELVMYLSNVGTSFNADNIMVTQRAA